MTITVHDCTPSIGSKQKFPAIEKLAAGLAVVGESVAADHLATAERCGGSIRERVAMANAIDCGLTKAVSTWPSGVKFFANDDRRGLIFVNEDGTRGAVIREPHLNMFRHPRDGENRFDSTITITRRNKIGFSWSNTPVQRYDRYGQGRLEIRDPGYEPDVSGYVRAVLDEFCDVSRRNSSNDWAYRWFVRSGGKWIAIDIFHIADIRWLADREIDSLECRPLTD